MSKNFELMQQEASKHAELREEFIRPRAMTVSRSQASARIAIEAFFRQWKLFGVASVSVLLLTILVTLLTRKEYLSEMKFLVQNARENVVVTPERTSPTTVVSDVTEAQVNSELEILHSHDVIDPIADPDWAAMPSSQRTTSAARQHEKLLVTFGKRLGTEIVRKTNIINVSVLGNTPEQAKDSLERLSAAYLSEHRRLQRPAGASEFFVSETEHARKEWDDATQKLVAFKQDHQILSVADRESTLDSQISDNETELFSTVSTLRENEVQLSEAAGRLKELPARQVTQQRTSPNQLSAEQLDTLIVDLENKRTARLTNYKETDRSVRELDQEIATAKTALNDAKTSPTREETTDVDPVWQQVRNNFVQNQIAHHALSERRAGLEARISKLRTEMARLQDVTVQFNNLEARADELKNNYQLYVEKRDQTQIEDAMDEHKLLNVTVAQQPTLSYATVHPRPVMNAMLGGISALFFGFCVVYFAEAGRKTIATPRELDALSRYPVLATVPLMKGPEGAIFQHANRKVLEEVRQ